MSALSEDIILREQQEKQIATMGRYLTQMAGMMAEMDRRLKALEKLSGQRVSIDHRHAKALTARIRARAEALCEKYGLDYKKNGAALRRAILRAVLTQYAVEDLHDLPVVWSDSAAQLIDGWSSFTLIRKLREKEE